MSNSDYWKNQLANIGQQTAGIYQTTGNLTGTYMGYPYNTANMLTTDELIDEFKKRNLVDNVVLERMLLDQKINKLQEEKKKVEEEIAKCIAEKLKG